MSPLLKLALEIGPLAVFFIVFTQTKELGEVRSLLLATGGFLAAFLAANAVIYAMTRTISRLAAFTGAIVLAMGVLTYFLDDATFIKMRPSLVNGAFALVLGFGLWRGRSYLQLLMGELLSLLEVGWMKLTRNWALYFAFMAVLNEVVWRSVDTETWVQAKTFLYFPLTLIFTISQTPLLLRYAARGRRERLRRAGRGRIRR
ncbi:MAG: septation protein IspZ, partial [Pseudomonadota bacterium]